MHRGVLDGQGLHGRISQHEWRQARRNFQRDEGQPVSRTAIVEQVSKPIFDTMTNVRDVYISYPRRKWIPATTAR